ncbi:hypothetical protein INR49_005894, partial [Caranx melampygus]
HRVIFPGRSKDRSYHHRPPTKTNARPLLLPSPLEETTKLRFRRRQLHGNITGETHTAGFYCEGPIRKRSSSSSGCLKDGGAARCRRHIGVFHAILKFSRIKSRAERSGGDVMTSGHRAA